MKKTISLLMALVMLFAIAVPGLAADTGTETSSNSDTMSFIDGEGKLNTVIITIPQAGTSYVEYYIEGTLISTAYVVIPDSSMSRSASDEANITYTDVVEGTTQEFTEPVSNYITSEQTTMGPAVLAYTNLGTINYKTNLYDLSGNPITRSLAISQQAGTTTYAYKTINSAAGTAASVVIGVISGVLSLIFAPAGVTAAALLAAAAIAAGTTIVGGIIQGAITKQYYVQTTPYDVRATYTAGIGTTTHYFDAERYQVALSGGGYSSDYYYEGYMPWNSSSVAYMFYSAFWSDGYAGVNSYS